MKKVVEKIQAKLMNFTEIGQTCKLDLLREMFCIHFFELYSNIP